MSHGTPLAIIEESLTRENLDEKLVALGRKPDHAVQPRPLRITIDCNLDPQMPSGLSLRGEGTEHRKMGKITIEKGADGKLHANTVEVIRFLSPYQKNGKVIQGHKLRNELANKQVLNACIMDALLANPQLVPDEWITGYTFFWGTIFRSTGGDFYVGCLSWNGDRQISGYYRLGTDYNDNGLAALIG